MLRKNVRLAMSVIALTFTITSCGGKKVMVPPRIDLQDYPVIALVQFSTNAEGNLDEFASQKFVEMIQGSQPGVRVLELGDEKSVLSGVDQTAMNYRAVRAIGEEYGVAAVIVGNLEITDVKPSVDLSAMLMSGTVRAEVEASLSVRLLDGATGATIWTNSCAGKESVAHIGMLPNGGVSFGAGDPEEAYGKLVGGLIYNITDDFRVRYVRQ
jgi:hypothetical protein